MKLCTSKRRIYFQRIAENRLTRRFRNQPKRRSQKQYERLSPPRLVLKAPEYFTLIDEHHRKGLLQFINRLKDTAYNHKRGVTIDFTSTKRMISDGTLLFRSELCILLPSLPPGVSIKCKPPRNVKVSQVLEQIGIYELLNHKASVRLTDEEVVHWKIAQGSGAEGEKYDDVLGHYEGVVPEPLLTGLYVGVTEAMTNSSQHAYIENRNDGFDFKIGSGRWWMFSQEKGGKIFVAFCDLGVGIPRSLPIRRRDLIQQLTKAFGFLSDGKMIGEAVKDSRSRTGKQHRGKGLKQLVAVTEELSNGHLCIFSNHGCYTNGERGEQVWDFRDSIMGTLITWSVPLHENSPNGSQRN